jgi:agmatine deiminase
MPVQVNEKKFVQFDYNPDYLKGKWEHLIFDPTNAIKKTDIETLKPKTSIKLDGGNVIKSKSKVIITNKIIKENPGWDEIDLINEIRELFEVDTVIIFPRVPYEYTGHADGILRFVDENTVLINDFKDQSESYMKKIEKTLQKYHLNPILFPYAPSNEKNSDGDYTAKGVYINYSHIGNLIILPTFDQSEDDLAYNKIKDVYPSPLYKIETIDSRQISDGGGVLNCITWNICKSH